MDVPEPEVLEVFFPETAYYLSVQTYRTPINFRGMDRRVAAKVWEEMAQFADTVVGRTSAEENAREWADAGVPARIVRKYDPDKAALITEAREQAND